MKITNNVEDHPHKKSLLQFASVTFGKKSEILKTNRCKRRTQSDDNTRHGHLVQLRQERSMFTYPQKALD